MLRRPVERHSRFHQPILREAQRFFTFYIVRQLLTFLVRSRVSDPANHLLGTPTFSIGISPQRSGMEGVGLMLLFRVHMWLWLCRTELRFPHSFVILPMGVFILWSLNALSIVILVMIGSLGQPSIALGGFHSQAGWIGFNVVALGLCFSTKHSSWFNSQPAKLLITPQSSPAAAYLMPLLAVLAAGDDLASRLFWNGMVYPLRFFAAAIVLWHYRSQYRELEWKPGWFGPLLECRCS